MSHGSRLGTAQRNQLDLSSGSSHPSSAGPSSGLTIPSAESVEPTPIRYQVAGQLWI
jgi:hypothetical protein